MLVNPFPSLEWKSAEFFRAGSIKYSYSSVRVVLLYLMERTLLEDSKVIIAGQVHNRIQIHTVYKMSIYRIQYSLAPITVYGPKKQVNLEKYR